MRISLFTFAALVSAAPAHAQLPQPSAIPVSVTTEPQTEKLLCRREPVIGSLIAGKKVCRTKPEWDQIGVVGSDLAQKLLYDGQSKGSRPPE